MFGRELTRRDVLRTTYRLGLGLSALSVADVLVACGTGSSTSTSTSTSSPSSTITGNLTFWWWGEENAPGLKNFVTESVQLFQSKYPGTTVNSVLQATESLIPGFTSACQAKQGADVQFMYSGSYAMVYVFRGCLKSVTDVVGADELKHILPSALAETGYKNKTWGLPWYASPHMQVYSKPAFEKAGLDPNNPPTNWDDFLSACEKLRVAGYAPWAWGVRGLSGMADVHGQFLIQTLDQTTDLLPVITGQASFTDAKFSQFLTWIDEMRNRKVFNDDITSIDYMQGQDMVSTGKAAMAEIGGAQVTDYVNKMGQENVGLMRAPVVGQGKLAGKMPSSSEQLLVPAWANTDLAAAWLKFLHMPDRLNAMYKASSALPVDDRFDTSTMQIPQHKIIFDWLKTESASNYQNVWPSQMDRGNLFLAVQAMLGGQATPQQAAQQVEQGLKDWRTQNPDLAKQFSDWGSNL